MTTREIRTVALWLLGALSALALSAVLWLLAAEEGKVSAFALVPFMWSLALGAGFVHHLKGSGLVARHRLASAPVPAA
jgi:hypothetical protein